MLKLSILVWYWEFFYLGLLKNKTSLWISVLSHQCHIFNLGFRTVVIAIYLPLKAEGI